MTLSIKHSFTEAALDTALMATFGETVLINKAGGDIPIQAIFERIEQNDAVGRIGFNDAIYTLTVKANDIEDNGIAQFDSITVRKYQYKAIAITIDRISVLAVIKIKRF